MNHLVGVDVEVPIASLLSDGEEAAFASFKKNHLAHADADASEAPTWTLSTDSLPASGWRALDDVTLLRFLRADQRGGVFNADASQSRLSQALAWRKRMRLDDATLLPRHNEYAELRVRQWVGLGHESRPVQFERLGDFLTSGNVRAFSDDEWLAHYARDVEHTFEQMRRAAQASGVAVRGYIFCADLEGIGIGILGHLRAVVPLLMLLTKQANVHHSRCTRGYRCALARPAAPASLYAAVLRCTVYTRHTPLLTKQVEAHFPEIVDHVVLFNAPRVFASIFPLVKAFMDPITWLGLG